LPVNKFGSGFPLYENSTTSDANFQYAKSFFNLNKLYKAPGSALRFCEETKEQISGITIPWVYIGTLFSTFCWHVEDLWLNSINYNHLGAIKTWYVVPASDKEKFDKYVL